MCVPGTSRGVDGPGKVNSEVKDFLSLKSFETHKRSYFMQQGRVLRNRVCF